MQEARHAIRTTGAISVHGLGTSDGFSINKPCDKPHRLRGHRLVGHPRDMVSWSRSPQLIRSWRSRGRTRQTFLPPRRCGGYRDPSPDGRRSHEKRKAGVCQSPAFLLCIIRPVPVLGRETRCPSQSSRGLRSTRPLSAAADRVGKGWPSHSGSPCASDCVPGTAGSCRPRSRRPFRSSLGPNR
jgi:hypothetical protein